MRMKNSVGSNYGFTDLKKRKKTFTSKPTVCPGPNYDRN